MHTHSSLLLYHGTGTGKTMTFINIANALKKTTVLFTLSDLWVNTKRYLDKFIRVPIYIIHYDSTQYWKKYMKLMKRIGSLNNTLVVIDEAHLFFTKQNNKLIDPILQNTKMKLLLMTATPIQNDTGELELMFSAMKHSIVDKITPELARQYVSYYPGDRKYFPSVIGPKVIEITECNDTVVSTADKYLIDNLNLVCPMMYHLIYEHLKTKSFIYTTAVQMVTRILDLSGIAYCDEKKIREFNEDKYKVMVSNVGFGLSYLGVNEIHILSDVDVPTYQQIIGRAIRLFSHKNAVNKTVTIYIWSKNWHQRLLDYEPIEKKLDILKHNNINT
jgi:superfamily II DNA or RNA helicase